jgi:hypothetical protein
MNERGSKGPKRVMEPDSTSYRPVRAIALLLLIEVIGLLGLGVYEFSQVDWTQVNLQSLSRSALETAAFVLFIPPAVLMLISALSFLFLRRRGWLLAALAQGLSLAVCLWLYSEFGPRYVYPIMAYCVLMILYLNSHDVRVVFHPRRGSAKQVLEASNED